jgi:hypothetical protein
MANYVVYNAIGTIQRVGECTETDVPLQAGAGEFVLVPDIVCSDATHYVLNGELQELQDFPEITQEVVNDSGEYTITLANIPEETSVTWPDGFISQENDGALECAVSFPDQYLFLLENVCYFPLEVVVNV